MKKSVLLVLALMVGTGLAQAGPLEDLNGAGRAEDEGAIEVLPEEESEVAATVILEFRAADCKATELSKAISTITNRFRAAGLAVVVSPSPDAPTAAVRLSVPIQSFLRAYSRIIWFATQPGVGFGIRTFAELSSEQTANYPIPAMQDVDKAKAPSGTKWIVMRGRSRLVRADEVVSRKDIGNPTIEPDGCLTFSLSSYGSSKLRKWKDWTFVLDNKAFGFTGAAAEFEQDSEKLMPGRVVVVVGGSGGTKREPDYYAKVVGKAVWIKDVQEREWNLVRILIDNPLSIALTRSTSVSDMEVQLRAVQDSLREGNRSEAARKLVCEIDEFLQRD